MPRTKLSEETKAARKAIRDEERKRPKFYIDVKNDLGDKVELISTIETFDGPVRLWRHIDKVNKGAVILDTEGFLFENGYDKEGNPSENTTLFMDEAIFIGIAIAYKDHPKVNGRK